MKFSLTHQSKIYRIFYAPLNWTLELLIMITKIKTIRVERSATKRESKSIATLEITDSLQLG